MMKKIFLFAILSVLCASHADAQKHKAKKVVEEVVIEKSPEEKFFDELLPSTAQIMFVDSVVVDKAEFLAHLPLSSEMGRIVSDKSGAVAYINEFEDTQILATGSTPDDRRLYIAHRYGEKWDNASLIADLDNENPDFPFLMANGKTLYFSAEGNGTVGGRDIFMTTFNAEESSFYEATNMGLPFNSPYNEYLLAISDLDNLGWLVSDRFQPEGKVCIYTFEPTAERRTFNESADENELRNYALMSSIRDSWKFGSREDALTRLAAMAKRMSSGMSDEKVEFIVNDNRTIRSLDEFKSEENRQLYVELRSSKQKLKKLEVVLENTRLEYAKAPKTKKYEYGRQITQLETELLNLDSDITKAEKRLRNEENK